MSANLFGNILKVMSFGESHGEGLGVILDGCPANLVFDDELLKTELERRRPGTSPWVSQRQEPDQVEILSGIYQGKTLGTPIAMMVRNKDARSKDYDEIKGAGRKGHADDTWQMKFKHTDHRGGGRSSGRETLARVMAGSVAKMILKDIHPKMNIRGYSSQIGPMCLTQDEINTFIDGAVSSDHFVGRYPSVEDHKIKTLLTKAQVDGESYGGQATIVVKDMIGGLGQPVFHKLKADLAGAVMGIGATAAIEIGDGIDSSYQQGTYFHAKNPYGGILGGISTGDDLILRITFKPTSSILDVAKKGRHDPCIVPRAIPVLESMVALVLADHALWKRMDRI